MGSTTLGWGIKSSLAATMATPHSAQQIPANPLLPYIMELQPGPLPVSDNAGVLAELYRGQSLGSAPLDSSWERPLLASAQSTAQGPSEQAQTQHDAVNDSVAGEPDDSSLLGEPTRWGYRVKRLSSAMRKMGLMASDRLQRPSGTPHT